MCKRISAELSSNNEKTKSLQIIKDGNILNTDFISQADPTSESLI